MIFQESRSVRRIVGRLEEGEELVESLTDFFREHDIRAGQIRAVGRFDYLELARLDEEGEGYETVFSGEGDFDVVSLEGNIATLGDEIVLRLEALMSAQGPVGAQVLSGQIREANVVEAEFVAEVFDDLALERRIDKETGFLALSSIRRTEEAQKSRTPSPAPSPEQQPKRKTKDETRDEEAPSREEREREIAEQDARGEAGADAAEVPESSDESELTGQAMSWDDVAEASESIREGDTSDADSEAGEKEEKKSASDIYGDLDFEEPLMEAGDVLEHPKLGRCTVMKVEEDNFVHVRLPRGRIRKLSLQVVGIEFKGEENGRSVFEAKVRR